jgi:Alpha-L-arabinofuranosidase B, catalytic
MIGIFINLWNRLTGGGSATTPLLDTYGGAAAAFSLRKLSSTYGGSAVRVRRSLDNSEQDIGFSGDNLDETALQAFVGYENLLTNSESLVLNVLNTSLTNNTTTSPTGTLTGGSQLETAVTDAHASYFDYTGVVGQQYTYSVYVKSIGGRYIRVSGSAGIQGVYVVITDTGAVYDGAGLYTVTPVANGWFRVTISAVATTTTVRVLMYSTILGNTTFLGDPTKGINIWGRQLNQGVVAQPYQQTVATANTANGFVTRWYTQDGNGENLLLQSQTFENIYWSKDNVNVTANSVNAPDGTLTADKLYDDTTNSIKVIYRPNITLAGPVIQSVYMKAAEYNFGLIQLFEGNAPTAQRRFSVLFNLSSGTVETAFSVNGGTGTYGIEAAGNGWYRCWVAWTVTLATGGTAHIALSNSGTPATWTFGFPQYLGNGSSGIYIWGAQLSQSSWLQGYQATTTTAVSRRDASQATAASQPRIVNAGVIERENGKPSIDHTSAQSLSIPSTLNLGTTYTLLAAFKHDVTNKEVFGSPSGSYGFYQESTGTYHNANSYGGTSSGYGLNYSLLSLYRSGTVAINLLRNGVQYGSQFNLPLNNNFTFLSISGEGPAFNLDGRISEGILYPTSLASTLPDINRNIGAYYQTQWTGASSTLLDQFGGSAAAFSLRNLSSSYRGPLVRVRRSSDNAETDIGGTFGGDLDVNSLLAFTGGQNLLPYSQDYTQVTWNKLGVVAVASATFAPDGTLTAQKINETAGGSFHILYTDITTSGAPMTYSFYAKAAERNTISVQCNNITTSSTVTVLVDLSTGLSSVITGVSGVYISHSVVNVGNGWWRIAVSGSTGSVSSHRYQTVFLNNGQTSYAGVAGSGVYVWGAQLTTGSVLQPYIPTTTAAINGANAFVTKWYDQSGIGDNLLLQSQTFDNASWLKTNVTASVNTISAPDGTLTGETIYETAVSSNHYAHQVSSSASGVYTYSIYQKYLNRKYILISSADGVANGAGVVFDVETASFVGNSTIGSGYSVLSYSITDASNGWYRYSVTLSTSGAPSFYIVLRSGSSLAWTDSYLGNTSVGVYVWGAQLSLSSELLRYQPTTTAAAPKRDAIQTTAASQPRIVNAGSVESENGKPSVFYNGSNNLLINSIPLPSRITLLTTLKNTSNSNQFFIEHSITANTNEGFYFYGAGGYMWAINRTAIHAGSGTTSWSGVDYSIYDLTYDSTGSVNTNGVPVPNGTIYGTTVPNTIVTQPLYIGKRGENTIFSNMNMSELVLYNSVLGASLPSARSNINTYYQIYWQGNGTALLDSYSGASAAYSLRNLSSAYTGPLIRVRRSSDNAERDIYGTFRGDLDLAALTSFVGANSGFVTTWYDQSGSGRHATQATAASQPRIVNAGAVDTLGGKPSLIFDGTNDFMSFADLTAPQFTTFYPQKKDAAGDISAWFTQGNTVGTPYSPVIFQSVGIYISNGQKSTTDNTYQNTNYILLSGYTNAANDGFIQVNNTNIVPNLTFIESNPSSTFNRINARTVAGSYSKCSVPEMILYAFDNSANLSAVNNNINNYYKIY